MKTIADYKHCTGCNACKSICPQRCITMEKDAYGFCYPKINESQCINCELCKKSCPVIDTKAQPVSKPLAYATYSKNDDVREKSTSGGIFAEIAKYVLSVNGIVYGAAYDSDFTVNHIEVSDTEQLKRLQGAKYSQSNLRKVFESIKNQLEHHKTVLFCGTSCQVAGLKSYLKIDYEELICIDFICHGVPSPEVLLKYIEYIGKKNQLSQKPTSINLRDKTSGWSNYSYSLSFEYANSHKVSIQNNNSVFMKLFVEDYISRVSCENCTFKGYSRASDFTLGDFWGVWDLYPEMDDNKGTSSLLIHSKKGLNIFEAISVNIVSKEITLDDVSKYNPYLLCTAKPKEDKDKVMKKAINGEFDSIIRYFKRKDKKPLLLRIKDRL